MTEEYITIEVTEKQLSTIISGLLFSCSVNVVSDFSSTNEQYITELFEFAKKLKNIKPDINLSEILFLEQDTYHDEISNSILTEFDGNIQVVTLEDFEQKA
jgi:hypothetical protein